MGYSKQPRDPDRQPRSSGVREGISFSQPAPRRTGEPLLTRHHCGYSPVQEVGPIPGRESLVQEFWPMGSRKRGRLLKKVGEGEGKERGREAARQCRGVKRGFSGKASSVFFGALVIKGLKYANRCICVTLCHSKGQSSLFYFIGLGK